MANSKDRSMAGVLALVLIALVALAEVELCLFVGYTFGARWGWLTMAVLMLAQCASVVRAIQKMHKGGRFDG